MSEVLWITDKDAATGPQKWARDAAAQDREPAAWQRKKLAELERDSTTVRARIARLRRRLTGEDRPRELANIMKGILDLLESEL